MTSTPQPLLEVADLSVSLGRCQILHRVSFSVLPGQIHALIGPNGAGKTTLIRSLLGGMPHTGEIRFRFRGGGRIGYVPQFLDFDRAIPLTVEDFLTVALRRRPVFASPGRRAGRRLQVLLDRTGCGHLRQRGMGSLSGGELRRVMLAQALSPHPELLLLDEPVSNVDADGARQFERLLLTLREQHGVTVVMVGHDIASILRVADGVTCINREVLYSGAPDALRSPRGLAGILGSPPPGGEGGDPPGDSALTGLEADAAAREAGMSGRTPSPVSGREVA
jgi:zinc transport system ATP-binding protein